MKGSVVCFAGLFLFVAGCLLPVVALADNCMECHHKQGVKAKELSAGPIRTIVDGKERTITLDRVFKYHGDRCPGAIIAYRATQYGIEILFPGEIPERDDLLIVSRTPAGGVRDFIDFFMKGDNPLQKTPVPVGMEKAREGFAFTITRKSTCETVEVQLNQALFPEDFFSLKKKVQEKTITPDQWKRFHGHMKNMVLGFSGKPATEMFGKPRPYKIMTWGTIGPGEQDRNVQKMRQKEKMLQSSQKKAPRE
ncbi:MAG: hypothetical protein GXX82_00720 [Syntrophorhabdus sp.]|jgi:hypothetical protein|nr:hypothetical protein [Syntrophorhabdus sp.]